MRDFKWNTQNNVLFYIYIYWTIIKFIMESLKGTFSIIQRKLPCTYTYINLYRLF